MLFISVTGWFHPSRNLMISCCWCTKKPTWRAWPNDRRRLIAVWPSSNNSRRPKKKKKRWPLDDFEKRLNQNVVEMITLDVLPLTSTKGKGSKWLTEFLKPELNLVSHRTIGQLLDNLAQKCTMPALQDELAGALSCVAFCGRLVVKQSSWLGRRNRSAFHQELGTAHA